MAEDIVVEFRQSDGRIIRGAGRVGETVRDLGMRLGVKDILGECGGNCACGTCHIYITREWRSQVGQPPKDGVEDGTLDLHSDTRRDFSRLGCQIALVPELNGLVVEVPPSVR